MTIATGIEQPNPASPPESTGNATQTPSAPPHSTPQAEPVAPIAPVTPQAPAPDDWKSKHDRLINESIPKLQSTAATEKNRADAAERDLAALREEIGDPDELREEVAHERDTAWADQIAKWLAEGATLRQVHDQVNRQMSARNTQRVQSETQRQSVDGLLAIVDTYDKPYAEFLRQMSKHGTAITNESIVSLRSTYESFRGTPAQAAAAASTAPAAPAGKEPPVVPQGGTSARIGDAPVWRPGVRPRDLIKAALAGPFGTNFDRPTRKE
jgi:hypothetical protein